MGIIEGRDGQPVMKSLPVDIIQSGDRMMQSFYFQQEEMFFSQPPIPPILGIDITGLRIPVSIHQFLGIVCLGHTMVMCRHSPFCQGTRFCRQRCQGKTIEAHDQIGFASKHHFVVGRKTEMNSLSHRIPPLSSSISSTHPAPRTVRLVRNAVRTVPPLQKSCCFRPGHRMKESAHTSILWPRNRPNRPFDGHRMKIRGCWFILWPFRPTEGYRKNGDFSYIYKTDVLCFEFMYIGWD